MTNTNTMTREEKKLIDFLTRIDSDYSKLTEFKNFNEFIFSQYIENNRFKNLHGDSFLDTINTIIRFINDSYHVNRFNIAQVDNKKKLPYISRVVHSIMGAGKSTALEIVAKMCLEKYDMPLLLVFNKNKSMHNLLKLVEKYARQKNLTEAVKMVDTDNVEEFKEVLWRYKIVGITQQRFRDIALEFGDYSYFKSYKTHDSSWEVNVERTIIFDEMPILFNSEIFDVGENDNCLDWFDQGAKYIDTENSGVTLKDIKRARLILNHLFSNEMLEVSDEECTSLATRKLKRHIEGSVYYDTLVNVLGQFEKIELEPRLGNRYKWFLELFLKDQQGVVNRDDKKTCIYCSRYIDYKKFGNILILDGTSDITKIFYDHGSYEFVVLKNYHDYTNRLRIRNYIINTSKEKRKNENTHILISDELIKLRNAGKQKNLKLLPLPAKDDINTYVKSGAITREQYNNFFRNSIYDGEESTAISLLNTTGDNDLSDYDGLALLSLPLRHPSVYKLAAIALYGTGVDISLNTQKTKQDSIKWFTDDKVQDVYESLVMMDLSQIIHRPKLRRLNDSSKVYIFLFNSRTGWAERIKEWYELKNIDYPRLLDEAKFKREVQSRIKIAKARLLDLNRNFSHSPGKINRSFKDWLNREWKDENKQIIIIDMFKENGIEIEIDERGWKYLRL